VGIICIPSAILLLLDYALSKIGSDQHPGIFYHPDFSFFLVPFQYQDFPGNPDPIFQRKDSGYDWEFGDLEGLESTDL
jgi:hypothetical protein